MKSSIRSVITILVTFLICTSCSNQISPVNVNPEGIAIKGYDTVAYFTRGEPVQGKKEVSHRWNGATWLFANNDHLELFKSTPRKYAPQYGGY
jgi:YHS domain-containing protein